MLSCLSHSNGQASRPALCSQFADDARVLEVMCEGGASVACRDKFNDTPLMFAARFGLENIVEFLMKLPGAFLDALTARGSADMTAYELAATWGFADVAAHILRKGTLASGA